MKVQILVELEAPWLGRPSRAELTRLADGVKLWAKSNTAAKGLIAPDVAVLCPDKGFEVVDGAALEDLRGYVARWEDGRAQLRAEGGAHGVARPT